ncbi:MAG: TorF family putative porin [candidate division Zixibacteria bacterium]|nr:TorF family putative porin [candidate division Zixibacteria bacterium]
MLWTKLMKKRIWPSFTVVLVFLLFSSPVFSEVGFQSDVTLVSRYIWRGFDTIANDRPAIQPSITFAFGKSGVWLNLWSAIALADKDFVELDLIAGYDKVCSKDITFSAGVGYFTFPNMPHYPDKNSTSPEAYTGITLSSPPLTACLTLYYDFNVGDGFYATLSLNQSIPVKSKVLCFTFVIGYTTQYRDFGVDPGFSDICLGISTDFGFKKITLTPSLNYVIVPNETINDENEIWVGLSIGWSTD